MFPLGGTLAKLLATVAALMTATGGVPRVQCVCPDGRVKFFCPGPSASGCCCDGSSTPGPTERSTPSSTEVKRRCCQTSGVTPTCCTHANPRPSAGPAGDGQTQAVKTCDCQRTLVADALAVAAKDAGDGSRSEADGFAAWKLPSVASQQAARSAWVERRFVLPPPDLVVVLCHFTC